MAIDFSKFAKPPGSTPGTGLLKALNGNMPSERGNYHRKGTCVERISKCMTKTAAKTGENLYIVEFEIVEVLSNDEPPTPRAGETFGWVQKLSNTKLAGATLAGLVCAALNVSDRTQQAMIADNLDVFLGASDQSVDGYKETEDQLIGKLVVVKAFEHTKRDGSLITLLDFKPFTQK